MITVSIIAKNFINWAGGIEFLINMLNCLNHVNDLYDYDYLKILVAVPAGTQSEDDTTISRIKSVGVNTCLHYYNDNMQLKDVINSTDSELCIVLANYIRRTKIPQLVYIPDFQEEHLKEYFSYEEILGRRKRNRYLFDVAKHVLISSYTVKNDIELFYNYPNVEYHVLPCRPLISKKYWDTSSVDLAPYDLPKYYFLVSNQFWQHKDHMTVFKAVNHAINHFNEDIHIVCTGLMDDYRNSDYVRDLKNYLDANKLNDNIHLLGFIPKVDQIEIMKGSCAVIQPTLFEGGAGGFAAQEAVSLGKKVILSDIEINMELSGYDGVVYFRHGNYLDLSRKIVANCKVESVYSIDLVEKIYCKNIDEMSLFYADTIKKVTEND